MYKSMSERIKADITSYLPSTSVIDKQKQAEFMAVFEDMRIQKLLDEVDKTISPDNHLFMYGVMVGMTIAMRYNTRVMHGLENMLNTKKE